MFVCSIGDAVVDVVAELSRTLVPGDDVPGVVSLSCGGQASNVAAWCSALGARSAVLSGIAVDVAGDLIVGLLNRHGVEVLGLRCAGDVSTGAIVSMVLPGGERTMISDRGAASLLRPRDVQPEWFEGCDWLHVSGYSLFDSDGGATAIVAAHLARRVGATVSVDVSAATLIEATGADIAVQRIRACGTEVVFANEAEYRALGPIDGVEVVVKRGHRGFRLESADRKDSWPALEAKAVRDTTGAGDAFAAGWIVGGPELAREAARACISSVGAMPSTKARRSLGRVGESLVGHQVASAAERVSEHPPNYIQPGITKGGVDA